MLAAALSSFHTRFFSACSPLPVLKSPRFCCLPTPPHTCPSVSIQRRWLHHPPWLPGRLFLHREPRPGEASTSQRSPSIRGHMCLRELHQNNTVLVVLKAGAMYYWAKNGEKRKGNQTGTLCFFYFVLHCWKLFIQGCVRNNCTTQWILEFSEALLSKGR